MKYLLTLSLLILSFTLSAQTDCDELVKYRDTELFDLYDKALGKYEIASEKKQRYEDFKEKLEEIQFTETELTVYEIASDMKLGCDIVKDILSELPVVSETNKFVVDRIEDVGAFLTEGKSIPEIVSGRALSKAIQYVDPLAGWSEKLYNYYKQAKKANENIEDMKKSMEEYKRMFSEYDKEIQKYEKEMSDQSQIISEINLIKNEIDKLCAGKAIIKVTADTDCRVIYDFGEEKLITAGSFAEFETEKGEHYITAKSTTGDAKWDTTVNVTGRGEYKVFTCLKKNIIKKCPLLITADRDCSLDIEGHGSIQLLKDEGKKIRVEFGERIFKAKSTGGLEWKEKYVIESENQKFIKIEFKEEEHRSEPGILTDSRDGKKYKTVKIGHQIWMAENLNYNTYDSWCYDDNSYNCSEYGRLYTWERAKNVCPAGWHLPSKSEFETLLSNYGGEGGNAYHALISGGSSGFSALFGGWGYLNGNYVYLLGMYTAFWSSSPLGNEDALGLFILSDLKRAFMGNGNREWGFSVRCLQD